jgi:tetratricopeptide (TPR) repeat protein
LEDLPETSIDDLNQSAKSEPVPRALTQAISTLQSSTNKYTRRSLRLLKVLTVLSHGEIFKNLKRFDPIDPFFPENVDQLRDLALIDVVPLVALGDDSSARERATANDPSSPKLLLVPRPVRDYVRSLMSEDERRAIVDGALEIYFGSRWREGKPSLQPLAKIIVWENGMSGLGNHHAILVAALRDCLARHNDSVFKKIFRTTEAYLQALRVADKFRDLQHASEEIFRLLDTSGKQREAARVAFYYGFGLRMLNQSEEAIRLFETSLSYAPNDFTKDWYAQIYLNLALTHHTLGDNQAAVKAATEVLSRSDTSDSTHHHARAIIVECNIENKSNEDLSLELATLEKDSRSKGHTVVANNVALEITSLAIDTPSKLRWLDKVIESKGDRYNQIRAAVKKSKTLLDNNNEGRIGSTERRIITEAYSYLYSQRLGSLFDDCHNALWRLMIVEGKKNVLLRMFRFSSFLWRIFGRHQREQEYLTELRTLISATPAEANKFLNEQSGFSYYASRLRALGISFF